MVESSRKTPGAGSLRPVNAPVPVSVEEDADQKPLSMTLKGRSIKIASIDDLWEIEDEWWRERPIGRMYYQVTTEHGAQVTLFRDLVSGAWYSQRD